MHTARYKPSASSSEGRGQDPVLAVVYLHGFLSSGVSTKARFFSERFRGHSTVHFGAIDFNPTPRDFATMTVTGQINRLRQYLLDRDLVCPDVPEEHRPPVCLIGSSFGGWVALHYAHFFGGVGRLLLLAPALVGLTEILSDEERERWKAAGAAPVHHPAFDREIPVRYDLHRDSLQYLEPVPPAAPTLIIHGRNDEEVPIRHSSGYAEAYPDAVQLVEMTAGHDLNDHLDLIWGLAESFLLGAA